MIDCVRHFHEMHYSQFLNRRIAELQSPAESTNPNSGLDPHRQAQWEPQRWDNHTCFSGSESSYFHIDNLRNYHPACSITTRLKSSYIRLCLGRNTAMGNDKHMDFQFLLRCCATQSIRLNLRAYGSTCEHEAQPASMKLNLRAYGSTCLYGHFFIVDLLLIL